MTETSLFWDGTSTGDADIWTRGGGYHMAETDEQSPFVDIFMRTLTNGTGNRGVMVNWLNELAVTGVATPIQVDTGAAINYGLFYENDAALNMAIASPVSDTRIDRIVIRRDWITQTARATQLVGLEGGVAPAIVQSPGPDGSGVYDIPLAQISITTGGVIAVTDEREYCTFCTVAGADTITTAHFVADSMDWEHRAQTTKSVFYGGPDVKAQSGYFSYEPLDTVYLYAPSGASWTSTASTVEGWQCTGTSDQGFHIAFKPPADYVPGTAIFPYVWWIDDVAGAGRFHIHSAWQAYQDSTAPSYSNDAGRAETDYTQVVDESHSTMLLPITDLVGNEMILYSIVYDNYDGGGDLLLIAGVEFAYTGYV